MACVAVAEQLRVGYGFGKVAGLLGLAAVWAMPLGAIRNRGAF